MDNLLANEKPVILLERLTKDDIKKIQHKISDKAKFSDCKSRMTRSKARSLHIDVNKLEKNIPSMKRKITLDDRKEAIKKPKLDKNPTIGLSTENNSISTACAPLAHLCCTGEAEKKRKVYKNLLGFNSASHSVEPTNLNAQSNCSPLVVSPPLISQSTVLEPNAIVKIEFRIGEVVWAKIKGFPAWPAKIKSVVSSKMILVVWFNDYRVTKVYKTQLFKFLINFDTYAKNFEKSIGLKTAAREALMYYGNNFYQDKI